MGPRKGAATLRSGILRARWVGETRRREVPRSQLHRAGAGRVGGSDPFRCQHLAVWRALWERPFHARGETSRSFLRCRGFSSTPRISPSRFSWPNEPGTDETAVPNQHPQLFQGAIGRLVVASTAYLTRIMVRIWD